MRLYLLIVCSLASFASYSMQSLELTQAYLEVSQVSLQGSQSSSMMSVEDFLYYQDEAINFLATGEETEALSDYLQGLKDKFPEFQNLSERELVVRLLMK